MCVWNTFSASGKIFEKAGHQTRHKRSAGANSRGGLTISCRRGRSPNPAPEVGRRQEHRAPTTLKAGHQTRHKRSAGAKSTELQRRGGKGGGTGLKSSNPTHGGWGKMFEGHVFHKAFEKTILHAFGAKSSSCWYRPQNFSAFHAKGISTLSPHFARKQHPNFVYILVDMIFSFSFAPFP